MQANTIDGVMFVRGQILRLGPSLELFGLSWGVSLAVLFIYPTQSNSWDGWDFPNDPSFTL